MTEDELYRILTYSVLAVNSCTVERVRGVERKLRSQGLFDPDWLAQQDNAEVTARLKSTGYPRATWIVAERLQELALFRKEHGFESVLRKLEQGQLAEAEAELLGIRGVGPKVISNFLTLLNAQESAFK